MSSSVASSSTAAAALRAAAASSNVGSTSSRTRLLRGSLSSRPGPGGPTGSFHLPCRKIVLEYCPHGASSKGTRRFVIPTAISERPENRAASVKGKAKAAEYRSEAVLETSRVIEVARDFPSVEVVVKENPNKHPLLRGFYTNGRTKEISLRNLESNSVAKTVQLLLEASGKKIVSLKRKPVQSISESARGIWSSFHGRPKQL